MTNRIKLLKTRLSSDKAKKIVKWAILSLCILLVVFGVYLLINLLYVHFMPAPKVKVDNIVEQTQDSAGIKVPGLKEEIPKEDMLEIPKISLRVQIYEGGSSVLEKGIWHRYPDRGNPVDGGNFILSGHRLSMGFTPAGTRRKSPLYHIDEVKVGDKIIVYWKKMKYTYKVKTILHVDPKNISIEDKRKDPILTLYTCSINGAQDKRVVLIGEIDKN